MTDPILLAYTLDKKGGGSPIATSDIGQHIKQKTPTWVHIDASNPHAKKWIEQEVSQLNSFIVEALVAEETRPRMMEIDNGILLILRGVNLNEDADPEDMVSIRLWVDKYNIISVRKRKLKAVLDIEQKIQEHQGPKDTGQFICMLTSRLFERMQPVLTSLDDTTDNIEEKILESADISLREDIIHIRKQAIMFRRYMSPQRDAIGKICTAHVNWLNEAHKQQLHEAHNHVTRYVEDLDAVRERSQIIKDELANILADRLNKNMYVLSVIAAIFLPLGFLTGLLGINVGGIPGADNPQSFIIFCGILTVIVMLQVILFKKLKWF